MPNDSVLVKFLDLLNTPSLVFAIGVIGILAFLVAKALPMIREVSLKKIEIAEMREKRKVEERQSEEKRDRERTEVIVTQNEIISGLVRSMDAQAIQMAGMIATIEESKGQCRDISVTVEDTNRKVSEIHTTIVKGRHDI